MAKYFTHKAVEDLAGIRGHTYDTCSERQVDKYHGLLTVSFQEIFEQPELKKKYPEGTEGVMGNRVSKHIVFYRIEPSNDLVIRRILHQRMDLKSHLEA